MPIPIDTAVSDAGDAAVAKATAYRNLFRATMSSMFAGAFVGLAIVLLVSVSAPLAAAGHPLTKLVQGAVFGLALTLVVFAGAELFTGNTMTMTQGLMARRVAGLDLARVWVVSLAGNVAGSIALAAVVHGGGITTGPFAALVGSIVDAKDSLSGGQLFWRAVLCNALVCLGLWMASRATSDGAKLAVLWWALLAFVGSGFEHSIANVTTFALGVLGGSAEWSQLARNLAWTVPGNIVGGALVVGAAYGWLGRPRPATVAGGSEPGEGPAPTAGAARALELASR